MTDDGSHEMEITYQRRLCPHPAYKFDIDKTKKRGRARVFTISWVEKMGIMCAKKWDIVWLLMWNSIMTYTGFLITWVKSGAVKTRFPTDLIEAHLTMTKYAKNSKNVKNVNCIWMSHNNLCHALKSWFFLRRGDNRTQIEFERGSFLSLCG